MNNNAKQMMRGIMAKFKREVPPGQRLEEADLVANAIEASPLFITARTILAYHALPDELPTAAALARWQATGRRILLPRVMPDGMLELADMANGLTTDNRYHIAEPTGPSVDPSAVDLAIIPAVAVDRDGYRLGRGGGYYDRLLPHLRCPVIAAVLSCQLVELVPREKHDVPVNAIAAGDTLLYIGQATDN